MYVMTRDLIYGYKRLQNMTYNITLGVFKNPEERKKIFF